MQCGLCLPVCPTCALDQNGAESPRGRIAIASALARGLADPTQELREHLDHCLGCLNCEKFCPAHVQYDELLIETRALLGPASHRPSALIRLITRPRWLRAARRMGSWIALPRWKSPLSRHLPRSSCWRSALLLLPSTTPAAPTRPSRPLRAEAERLALFPGCVASIEDAAAQQAAMTLLRAVGFQVELLPAFCCGAMDLHGGELATADAAAQRLRGAGRAAARPDCFQLLPAASAHCDARYPAWR